MKVPPSSVITPPGGVKIFGTQERDVLPSQALRILPRPNKEEEIGKNTFERKPGAFLAPPQFTGFYGAIRGEPFKGVDPCTQIKGNFSQIRTL